MRNARKKITKSGGNVGKAGGDIGKAAVHAGKAGNGEAKSGEVAKASASRKFLPYVAAAAVVFALLLVFIFMQQQAALARSPAGQAALPSASSLMTAESCGLASGVVMGNDCAGGFYLLGEVESNSSAKNFCCGKSVDSENVGAAPPPAMPSAGSIYPPDPLPGVAQGTVLPAIPDVPPQAIIPGGDADANGCIGSAGYTWCEAKQKCLREWEENCTAENVNADASLPAVPG